MLREVPNLVERDLSRFHHRRYSDRWRYDERGVPLLTLREIWVLISDSQPDSALAAHFNDGSPRWGIQEYLLADVYSALTGQPHAGRPKPKVRQVITPARRRAKKQIEQRLEQRRQMLGIDT